MTIVKKAGCDSPAVADLVQQVVTGSKQVTDVGAELSFVLPSSSVERFSPLFSYLDGMCIVITHIYYSNVVVHQVAYS